MVSRIFNGIFLWNKVKVIKTKKKTKGAEEKWCQSAESIRWRKGAMIKNILHITF